MPPVKQAIVEPIKAVPVKAAKKPTAFDDSDEEITKPPVKAVAAKAAPTQKPSAFDDSDEEFKPPAKQSKVEPTKVAPAKAQPAKA